MTNERYFKLPYLSLHEALRNCYPWCKNSITIMLIMIENIKIIYYPMTYFKHIRRNYALLGSICSNQIREQYSIPQWII